jgi:spoIIIJ-associated protein
MAGNVRDVRRLPRLASAESRREPILSDGPQGDPRHLLQHLGFTATVTDRRRWTTRSCSTCQTEDPGRLIGRSGQTLGELQFILNRIVFKGDTKVPRIILDVGGYRQQARDQLAKRANEAAEEVRRWGDVVELEPMNAFDRRIVHQALKDDPDIETQSVEVDGSEKKVILIRPKRS